MSLAIFRQRKIYEQAAARYAALLASTRDPSRQRMLQEMIARELDAAAHLEDTPASDKTERERRF